MKALGTVFLLLLSVFLSNLTYSAAVQWEIDSLVFDDGGMGGGFFTYDESTNEYTNVNIFTTSGSTFDGEKYQYLNPSQYLYPEFLAVVASDGADLTGVRGLGLIFSSSLSDVGGVVGISGFIEGFCNNDICDYPVGETRYVLSGQVSAVPIPASGGLMLLSLNMLLVLKFSRSRARSKLEKFRKWFVVGQNNKLL